MNAAISGSEEDNVSDTEGSEIRRARRSGEPPVASEAYAIQITSPIAISAIPIWRKVFIVRSKLQPTPPLTSLSREQAEVNEALAHCRVHPHVALDYEIELLADERALLREFLHDLGIGEDVLGIAVEIVFGVSGAVARR
jgi:hypothetical protein